MGLFDVVIARADCPSCGYFQEWRVQYKDGYCWHHEYRLGDRICWFDPPGRPAPLSDDGENVGGLVTVPGFIESGCSRCGLGEGAALWFRDNVVHAMEITLSESGGEWERLEPSSGWMRFWSRRVAGGANEDRLELSCRGDRWTVAIADGAGGLPGGDRGPRGMCRTDQGRGRAVEPPPGTDLGPRGRSNRLPLPMHSRGRMGSLFARRPGPRRLAADAHRSDRDLSPAPSAEEATTGQGAQSAAIRR